MNGGPPDRGGPDPRASRVTPPNPMQSRTPNSSFQSQGLHNWLYRGSGERQVDEGLGGAERAALERGPGLVAGLRRGVRILMIINIDMIIIMCIYTYIYIYIYI